MMCGNASRCIGKYLYEKGLTDKTEIRLLTLSGIKTLLLHVAQSRPSHGNDAQPSPSHQGEGSGVGSVTSVTVDMGEPSLEDESLFLPNRGLNKGFFVSMGNPHYVIFTDNIDQVEETGHILEHHPAFPQRCNIEFARVEPDGHIRTRVWERGSGITMACGTGACATAVAAVTTGRGSRQNTIVMDGGSLDIEWAVNGNHVYMTGPAQFVFDGEAETSK
jgi:diaminopimelate epimerase